MQTVEIRMPQVSMGDAEGVLLDWLKVPGDAVEEDEVVVTIETAKAEVEVVSPVAGRLESILVEAGAIAQAGDVLGYVEVA